MTGTNTNSRSPSDAKFASAHYLPMTEPDNRAASQRLRLIQWRLMAGSTLSDSSRVGPVVQRSTRWPN